MKNYENSINSVIYDDYLMPSSALRTLNQRASETTGEHTDLPPSDLAASPIETSKKPTAICLADVVPESIDWLWHPYIARGCITMLDGDPGLGKSNFTLALAAALSKGRPLPNQDKLCLGTTLLLSCEDNVHTSMKPRLDSLGADSNFIYAYQKQFTLDTVGMALLRDMVSSYNPQLIVIDPLFAYIGGKIDTNAANKVRTILAPLAELAASSGIAIVCVRHLNKSTNGQSLLYRGMGSIDFVAASRSVLTVMQSPTNEALRVILHTKTNIGPKGSALGFTMLHGKFLWQGEVDISEKDFLYDKPRETTSKHSRGREAEEFLLSFLKHGPKPSCLVLKKAYELGISTSSLNRVKDRLDIISKKGRGADTSWTWELPHSEIEPPPLAKDEDLDHLEKVDEEPDVEGYLQHMQDIQDSQDLAHLSSEHLPHLESRGTEQ